MTHTLRAARGYRFESHIVEELNKGNWWCRRMGGSSTGWPDEVATNNLFNIILAIEAKSTVGDYCHVDKNQYLRCLRVLEMFDVYDEQFIVLAFKFAARKENKENKIKARKLFYNFVLINNNFSDIDKITKVICDQHGKVVFKGIAKDDQEELWYNVKMFQSLKELKECIA